MAQQAQPLGQRDAQANNIVGAFDFTQPARGPVFVSEERQIAAGLKPRIEIIYAAYGAAILVGLAFVIRVTLGRSEPTLGSARREERR